ncbi:MAG: hypothetical protein ACYCTE_11540 [Acidimicrobiales bacterium]
MPMLVWQWRAPTRSIATIPLCGALGARRSVTDAQAPPECSRRDLGHVAVLAGATR